MQQDLHHLTSCRGVVHDFSTPRKICTRLRVEDVIALLGKPGTDDRYRGERQLTWEIGPERDSFFQVDSDFLFVAVGRDGIVKRVEQVQG